MAIIVTLAPGTQEPVCIFVETLQVGPSNLWFIKTFRWFWHTLKSENLKSLKTFLTLPIPYQDPKSSVNSCYTQQSFVSNALCPSITKDKDKPFQSFWQWPAARQVHAKAELGPSYRSSCSSSGPKSKCETNPQICSKHSLFASQISILIFFR